jgi:putative ABC transport system permease protein
MIRNYFTIAWRSLTKNILHTVINVFGLMVGISSCLVIYLIVSFELGYNTKVAEADQIYRVYSHFSGSFEGTNRGVNTGVQQMVKDQFTGVDAVAPINSYNAKVSVNENGSNKDFEGEKGIAVVDENYFQLINGFEWIEGTPQSSITRPLQVVLSIEKAKKYFGTTDAKKIMGSEVRYNDSLVVTVSGLVKLPSYRTDFEFTDFISKASIESSFLKNGNMEPFNWGNTNSSNQLFIKVTKGTSLASIEAQLKKVDEAYKEKNKDSDWFLDYKLQPLSDLHFNGTLGIFDNSRPAAHKPTLTTLTIIAVLLLLIAAINFINLETAQAVKRAREVGVRKVLGSTRLQLIGHFLGQSMMLTVFAVLLSLPLSEISLVFFSDFVPAGVTLNIFNTSTILFLMFITLMVGVLSGMYPAFVLSSFLPALALKNQAHINGVRSGSGYLRKGLIVFQFAFAQLLIIGTFVILSQVNFMLNKDLGFKKDAIINLSVHWREPEHKRLLLKEELKKLKEVEILSFCNSAPSENGFSSTVLSYKKEGKEEIKTNVYRKFGDENYLPLYGIELLAGRNLLPSDSMREVLVNETYLKEIGLTPQEAIGEEIWEDDRVYPIVGVVKDFHIMSLTAEYQPVYMSCENNNFYNYSIKLPTENGKQDFSKALVEIENTWKKVYPDEKFEYEFLDETILGFYKTEQKMSKLAGTAMVIAIIICCLGLFGLASFTSIQRTKEIGVRKVLGATINSIVLLLSTDFLKLVLLSFAIAAPLAYLGAQKFLEGYAFRTIIGWQLFFVAGFSSIVLAFVTVSYHAVKAGLTNPVDSLKSE